jgi:NitT/TauT family transport system permease protein
MRGRHLLSRTLPVLALLLVWEVAARLAGARLFPPASAVVAVLVQDARHGPLLHNLAVTLGRVAAAFVLAMAGGSALGIVMGRMPRLDRALDSLLTGLLNLPALVSIVLIYVWFGLSEATAIAAVALNKLPSTAVTVREGARALDLGLADMARSFRIGRAATLRHVILPQLYPYLFGAARSGLALIWKIVLVAELLGRSDGVGFQIQVLFQLFDVTGILAYTLAFVAVVQGIEWGLLQPLERRANRWR